MKSRVPIIAAIILGVIAVFALMSYVNSVKEESQYPTRSAVAVNTDLAEGSELQEGMLFIKRVPAESLPRQAITSPEEQRQIIGRSTRVALRRGDLVLFSDLEMERRGGLSSLIPEGERAFTVEIAAGVQSELLQLNDHVDILGIFELPGQDTRPSAVPIPNTACVVLLQNVNVIAIGETIGQVVTRPQQFGRGGTITFSVTLPEAQLLMFAAQHGELALALRREGEIQVLAREDLPRITYEELERVIGELDARRKNRVVQIMRGREIEEVTIDTGPAGNAP